MAFVEMILKGIEAMNNRSLVLVYVLFLFALFTFCIETTTRFAWSEVPLYLFSAMKSLSAQIPFSIFGKVEGLNLYQNKFLDT